MQNILYTTADPNISVTLEDVIIYVNIKLQLTGTAS